MFLHIYSEASAAGHLKSCIFIFWVLAAFDAIGQHSLYQSFSSWTGNLPGISKMCGSIRAPSISQSMLPRPDSTTLSELVSSTTMTLLLLLNEYPLVCLWVGECLSSKMQGCYQCLSFPMESFVLNCHPYFSPTITVPRFQYLHKEMIGSDKWRTFCVKGDHLQLVCQSLKPPATPDTFRTRLTFHILVWWIFQKKNKA